MDAKVLPSEGIDTRLIGGFLGAGKTTFILNQLESEGARVAVLVNEFGKLGIDGDLLRLKGGLQVVEMPGGCICCSQRLGLVETIRQLAESIAPERLLIEPSGVAEISELLQVLSDPSLAGVIRLNAVITLIDAETFLAFSEPEAFGLFFLDQVRCADLILVNKVDLVSPEVLQAIEERIAQHNPAAVTIRTTFGRTGIPLPIGTSQPSHFLNSIKAPNSLEIECIDVVPEHPLTQQALPLLEADLQRGRFGRVIRGKGFLEIEGRGWLDLQIVSGRLAVKPMPAVAAARLVLIGFGLKQSELEDFVRECRS